MRTRVLVAVLATTLIAAGCTSSASEDHDTTLVQDDLAEEVRDAVAMAVINANVYTADESQSTVTAFGFDKDGVIVAVGDDNTVLDAMGDDAVVIDLDGQFVAPGFQDTHLHVPEAGINEGLCFLEPNETIEAYEQAIAGCLDDQPGDGWGRAAGASLFGLRNSQENPIDVLDRVAPDRPVLVLDDIGHAVWTNTKGLEAAGISADDADPQGGIFHRDASGRLTGLLLEDAQHRVRNISGADDEAVYDGLLVALDQLAENGVTSASDAGGYWTQRHDVAWLRAAEEDALTVRAHNSLYLYPDMDLDEQLAEFEKRFSNNPDNLLQFDTAKIYIDGILDLGTAALIEPYHVPFDENFPSGFYYFDEDDLAEYTAALHEMGFRFHFHVIGDAAVRTALDSVEALDDPAATDRRHRTTHTYMVHPDDMPRFAELGVVADFQEGPDSTATDYHEYLVDFIGDRAHDLIPVAAVLEAGADVSLSSDWDADPLSPVGTIERALTRDENALADVETAIDLVTIGAAYALGHDDRTGSIEVGKFADFVVLDKDLLDIAFESIGETRVVATVLGGSTVYGSLN